MTPRNGSFETLKFLAILQARMSSTRLPGKVLKLIEGRPMLALEIERLAKSRLIDDLVIATSNQKDDDKIESLCRKLHVDCFRGDLEDVLDRFYQGAVEYNPAHVVRITGDCPLIDSGLIDSTLEKHIFESNDYTSNIVNPTYPDGLDVEVMRFEVLKEAWQKAQLPSEREHVTPYIYSRPCRYKIGEMQDSIDRSDLRWTVDTLEDLEFVRVVFSILYQIKPNFTMRDVFELLEEHPELTNLCADIDRNEGYARSIQQDNNFLQKCNAGAELE